MNRAFTYILTLGLLMIGGVVMGQRDNVQPQQGGQATNTSHGVIVGGSVFGGGNLANVAGSSSVTISQTQLSDETQVSASIAGDVYGGGAKAHVNSADGEYLTTGATTSVTLTQGNVTGSVYGGGLGVKEGVNGTADTLAQVFGPVTVNINGGTVSQSVFGCNNYNGAPQSTVVVNVNGGTISQNVFGGGNLASTPNTVAPEVNIDGGIVGNDVYGGGALADVGGTTVNIMGGTVSGDIYGGGLGQKKYVNGATSDIAAYVNGDVHVKIGNGTINTEVNGWAEELRGDATILGSVYGCNNLNGSPKGDVIVDIFQTHHNDNNTCGSFASLSVFIDEINTYGSYTSGNYLNKFAIKAVYGGGNMASYSPDDAANNKTQVRIYTCANTIHTVYGGGNAANATKVNTIICGGRFDRIFGGGNGYSESGNHTLPYYDGQSCVEDEQNALCPDYNPGADISGSAITQIHGGLYRQIFGGSNQKGNVANAQLSIDDESGCSLLIKESFGGANEADITGNVTTTLACSDVSIGSFYGGSNLADIINGNVTLNVYGGNYQFVYGGSKGRLANNNNNSSAKAANIQGNVTLNLYGGTISTAAFGGSDVLGNISGSITVNVIDHGDCALSVPTVYGGGNATPYNPDLDADNQVIASPVVNIIHGTVTNVFGGAFGNGATVTANPQVNIGYTSSMSSLIPTSCTMDVDDFHAVVTNNVYGGGEAAEVAGSTLVTMQKSNSSVGSLFGGGNQASVGFATVDVLDGNVSTGIYGGCNTSGSVGGSIDALSITDESGISHTSMTFDGDIAVNIKSDLGSDDAALTEGIYGGGKGHATETTGTVTVTIDKLNNEATAPVLYSDVYGGSAFGQVSTGDFLTKVDFKAGTINGTLYGGGQGSDTNMAEVSGDAQVIINGNVTAGVYGGCNVKGIVKGFTQVDVTSGTLGANSDHGSVYGGGLGNNTKVKGDVTVNINGTAIINGDVYGGSAKGLVNCKEDGTAQEDSETTVTLTAGTINGDLYGGGHGPGNIAADVFGPVLVTVNGGSVNNVFGCNNIAGAPQNTVQVDINNNVAQSVYGGGNLAAYTYTTDNYPEVNINNGTMVNVFGGGKGQTGQEKATVTGNPKVTIGDTESGHYAVVTGNVFGGGDAAKVVGNTTVVYNDSHASSQVANIFGGSNAANIEVNSSISGTGKTNVTLTNGKVTSALYGGCNSSGTVQGDITVALNGGTIGSVTTTDVVYGGGQGHSTATGGDISVTLNGTTVYGNLYGGSALGSVNAAGKTTTVTLSTATLHGKVFGGGMGSGTGTSTQATTLGNATVNINVANTDGKLTGIYGGANVNGDVAGDINVYVNANVGSFDNNIKRDIYGGGLGANTTTGGNVTVTVGDQAGTYQPVVYGDVYGGSQLGSVNDAAGDKTKVDFLNGTLHGNIYGGGLGDANDSSKGWVNGEVIVNVGSSTQTAENCHIDLRGCNVYGCNNTNGSPQADVTVNIYKTSHTTTNAASYTTNTGSGVPTFAIDNVFGGGNKASYSPENGASNSTKKTNVIIHDCSNTIEDVFGGGDAAEVYKTYVQVEGGRFNRVFAGGNGEVTAANIGAGGTSLLVQAGIIHQLFGGSNEKGTISGPISVTLNHDNENCPEEITEFFGGSNLAAIGTDDNPAILKTTIACGVGTITEVYGGSNAADIIGNVTLNIEGGTITNAYGGSKGRLASDEGGAMPANILDVTNGNGSYGNVTLNLFGGTIDNAFGGSNKNGDIDSKITVNMLDREATNCGLTVHNIFGASNLAAYGPNSSSLASPEVNLIHGTISKKSDNTGGSVFGGGKGSTAAVTANPKVTIGYDATAMSTLVTGLLPTGVSLAKSEVEVKGNVYGGGDEASVTGATIVKMLEEQTTNTLTSTSSDVNGDIYGGGNKATISGNTTVTIEGGTVTNDVYGGGAFADVGTAEVTGQNPTPATEHIVTITGGELNGNVYGGGLGGVVGDQTFEPKVNGIVTVNIGSGTVASNGTVSDPAGNASFGANSSVYGCNNAKGSPQDDVYVNIYQTAHTTSNQFENGTEYAIKQVFGGGRNAHYAPQNGNEYSTKRAHVNVYTCYNTIEDVFGGGDAANAVGVETLIKGGRFNRIFGGGNGAGQNNPGADIGKGGVKLTINGGQIGSFFGGSNELGSISGPLNVTVQQQAPCGLDITDFFCGSNMVDITGDVNTTIECGSSTNDYHINNLYGGSNQADITGNVSLTVKGGTYDNIYGGSKGDLASLATQEDPDHSDSPANISGNVTLNIYGGTVTEAIFGGSNINGSIGGNITVTVEDAGSTACPLNVANADVYGGDNLARYTAPAGGSARENNPIVYINHATVKNVFGGGKGNPNESSQEPGMVTGKPAVYIGDDTETHCAVVTGNVYGGGDAAKVVGNTKVTYNDNNIVNNVNNSHVANLFGGGNAANITGTTEVNMTLGKVTNGIYGGCNSKGTVGGNITVDVEGGIVGANTNNGRADIYGGGFGGGDNGTFTTGNVTVTLRDNAVVWGDLYGGSAFGSVNGNTNSKTTVNLQNDKLHGKVFGGGKGQLGTSTLTEYTAVTNGNVELNLTAANTNGNLTGIYGGANVKGNVAGNINVNVNANVGSSGNNNKRDIYGGGLGANTTTGGNVTVTIGDQAGTYQPVVYGDVYGGSQLGSVNDASGDKTTVNFLNGTLHGNIYGGGLGDANDSSKGQVNGEVVVNVSNNSQSPDNCHIDLTDAKVYGCNNTNGSPQDNVTVNIYRTSHNETNAAGYTGGSPTYSIKKVFGGGNHASYNPTGTQKTSVVIYGCDNTIEDVFGGGDAASVKKTSLEVNGGRFNRVFAGGNGENGQADIGTGGTSLLVKAGKIHQLFGGSNKNGTINGPITVNLNHENSTCTEKIDEFFGGSNEAAIGTNANPATLNTTIACGVGEITDIYGGSNAASIIGNVTLNIYGGKITNAYGGSKGVSGGTAADIKDARNSSNQPLGTHGKVTLNLYGGEITNAFGGSNFNGNIENKITVNMSDSEVTSCGLIVHNIYGGSNLTLYTPNSSSLASPEVNLIHGTVSKSGENYGDVFGGGKGNTAVVTANPKVTIGDNNGSHRVIVQSNVYGGGDAAKVIGNTTVEYNDNHTNSTVANIFGGGNAASVEKTDPEDPDATDGKTSVTMTSGKVTSNVYGGCNSQGTVQNTTTVKVKGGEVQGSVFGGGKGEDTVVTGQAIVRIIAPSTIGGDVFGGGDEGEVNGGTDVKVMATDNE